MSCSYEWIIIEQCKDYNRFVERKEIVLSVFNVLTKFEDAQFLHSLKCSDNDLKDKSDTSQSETRMLVPLGPVEESSDGMVDIKIPSEASSRMDVACYDMHRRWTELEDAWTTQVKEKELLAKEAEEHARTAQRESVQASQRAMFLAKQVEINEQEKKQALKLAEEARHRALVASQQAEALQAETESLKHQLQSDAAQLARVQLDAFSAAAVAKELHSKAEQLQQQVDCVRAQLSLHAGRHDPSKLVVLDAVCARAGTNVPSKLLKITGEEMTVQILRACRSSQPFSFSERDALVSINELSYREPAVKVMATALLAEADRQAYLIGQMQIISTISTAMGSTDEQTEYADMCAKQVQRNPLRSQFRSDEEKFIVGYVRHSSVSGSTKEVELCDSLPVADDYVKSIKNKLALFLHIETQRAKEIPPLPLDSSATNAMGKGMLDELQVSWDSYHSQTKPALKIEPGMLLGPFKTLLNDVLSSHRVEMQKYLWECFAKAMGSTRDHLLHLANFLPLITVSDVVRSAFGEETLRQTSDSA
ncbi:unnamed protein product [Peronospora destructor]|uniref:Uncharacterized protein n=1 Tax=Peronospora destructor TaxID=86335 RepID=A0AAV0VEE1_9STRA|nr:unnamed protein product [Peronospora destructor]